MATHALSLAGLVAAHSAQLGAARERFSEADLAEHLQRGGLARLNAKRPRVGCASVTLEAGQAWYDAAPDGYDVLGLDWGREQRRLMPHHDGYLGQIPILRQLGRRLHFNPAPTSWQIMALGAEAHYHYFAEHHIDEDGDLTTVAHGDRDLLLHAALIAAMQALATANVSEPIQLHRGIGGVPSNSTPAAWYKALLDEWERR